MRNYNISDAFNLQGFLASCVLADVALHKITPEDAEPLGQVDTTLSELTVYLLEETDARWALIETAFVANGGTL